MNGVGVVGLYVRDQDEALDFYVNKLGFQVHTDARNGDDLTPGILTQILIERHPERLLPVALLHAMLRANELALEVVRASWRQASAALEALFCLLGAALMALGLWGSVPLLAEAVQRNHWIGNEGVFTAPVWPVKTIIVVGLAVCLVQFLRLAAAALRSMKRL